MPLGMEVGLSPDNFVVDGDPAAPRQRDTVLDGNPAPPPLKVHSPQFSANVRCGQTAGCMH